MNAHLFPGILSKMPSSRQSSVESPPAAPYKDWAMLKHVGWTATTAIIAILIWQSAATDPVWPRTISGLLLVVIRVLAGLRLGADSAANYMADVQRVNKVLGDQNRELQDANVCLLRQVHSSQAAPSKTA